MENYKFEEYLASHLFKLNSKITKIEFNNIIKFYKWKFNFKSIHIVGTNGKGSNAKYLNDELILQNYKVGLFTSPHIVYMYERIKINNQNIDFQTLVRFTSEFVYDFPKINFGFFDLFFLSALRYFIEKQVDIAIFEAGIGARKDIVNYLNHNVTLITSIANDHSEILGNTIEQIAKDKSYSIKGKTNVYISDAIDKSYLKILELNKSKANNFFVVKTKKSTFETINISLAQFVLKNEFKIKEFKSKFSLPQARVEQAIINNQKCYLDVAHNLEAIKATLHFFKFNNIEFDQIVLSLSKDKEHIKIIEEIKKHFKIIYIYENKGRKPLNIKDYDIDALKIISLERFIKQINSKTLFIGSFYLVSEIKILLGDNHNKQI